MMKHIIFASTMTVVAAFILLITIEWIAGCGEPVYSADGTWRVGECVFLSSSAATGRW
jgi:hypothetical protein